MISLFQFFSAQHKTKTNTNNKNTDNIIYTYLAKEPFGKITTKHISQSPEALRLITEDTGTALGNEFMGLRIRLENGGFNRENNKDHISQSRRSALDGEEHIGEWRIQSGK